MSGWESNDVEHTFSTGRTMRIRRALSMQWLVLKAVEDDDPELATGLSSWFETGSIEQSDNSPGARLTQLQTAAKVQRAVVEAMFLRPRVYWNQEDMPLDGPTPDGEMPAFMLAADLKDDEMTEILEMAFKGVAEAARFREQSDGSDGGGRGKGVGTKPKPRARSGAGKR